MKKLIAAVGGVVAEILTWLVLSPLLLPMFQKFPTVTYSGLILIVGLPFLVTYSCLMAHFESKSETVPNTTPQ